MTTSPEKPVQSRTNDALDWLDANPGQTAYAAAKRFGLTQGTLSRGKKMRAGRETAPSDSVSPIDRKSRTQEVLAWLDANPNESVYAASHRFNISQSVISRAKKARAERERKICGACGQPVFTDLSKTQQALRWLQANPDKKKIEAAEKFGVTAAALSGPAKETLNAMRCETCGQVLKSSVTAR